MKTNLAVILYLVITEQLVLSQVSIREDWGRHYVEKGVSGAFILHDVQNDSVLIYNPSRVDSGFLPASTFKIFNSLVALETGAVKDADEVIPWDHVARNPDWDRDLSMRQAMPVSAVWFYQESARRIGLEKMQKYLDLVQYGNRDPSGGIDVFWLSGNLRITPREQVKFITRLAREDLPFSRRTQDLVREIMIRESTPAYVLRAKTGWSMRVDRQIGWYVGYLERNGRLYSFANNIDIKKNEDADARIEITRNILKDLGLINSAPDPNPDR